MYNFCPIFTFISGAQRVNYIWPHTGSINGGTHVTIVGSGELLSSSLIRSVAQSIKHIAVYFYFIGFAQERQFQLNPTDDNFGNRVMFVSSTLSFPCDVERDSTHGGQILCYTR